MSFLSTFTAEQFQRAVGCSTDIAATWFPVIAKAMADWDITNAARAAGFLAQVSHECADFTKFTENLNYSAQGLANTWRKRFAHPTAAKVPSPNELAWEVGRTPYHPCDQKRLANIVYGGRFGNRPNTDDGWRYRGRGPIAITFHDNYAEFGIALGLDLVNNPDLLLVPTNGAQSAGRYWASRHCNQLMDAGKFDAVTRAINGGMTGAEHRVANLERTKTALGMA